MAGKCPDCSDRLMITPAGNACCSSCNYSRKASAGEIKGDKQKRQSLGKSTQRSISPPQETNKLASKAQDAAPSVTDRVKRDSNDKSSNQRKKVSAKRIGELNKNYEKERAASQSGEGMEGLMVFFAILAIGAIIIIVTNEFANDWSGGVEKESASYSSDTTSDPEKSSIGAWQFDKDELSIRGLEGIDELSITGLEGIAKDGMRIVIEDYSKFDKEFDKKAILNQVKLRLLQAGIKVNGTPSASYFLINANPVVFGGEVIGYTLRIEAKRSVTFAANGKIYGQLGVPVWKAGGQVHRLTGHIDRYMDKFLLDYLKANPKKA